MCHILSRFLLNGYLRPHLLQSEPKMKNRLCKYYSIFFFKKMSVFFQIDITSSDLNEFWIGQKIWKAADLLFHLSTTFMGVWARYRTLRTQNNSGPKKTVPFSPDVTWRVTSLFPRILSQPKIKLLDCSS